MASYRYMQLNENVEEMFIGPFGSSLKNEAFVDEAEAFCMVYEQKHAIKKTMDVETRYVNREKYEELKRFNIRGGDIIVSCRGTIGETFIVPDDAPLGIMHPSIMKIRLKPGVYNKQYFNLLLCDYLKRHEEEANGSGIKMAISAKELGASEFPVPAMEEQNHIACVFDELETIITLRKQQLSKLDELVKSRFIELFGDTKTNECQWNTLPLHKVLESGSSVSYGIVQTGDDIEDGVPVFRPIDIAGGKIPRREQLKRTANEISNQYSRTLLKGYELLITVRGSVGETFRVSSEFAGCNVGRNIVPLRFDTEIVDYSFMQHFFAQEGTKRVLESMTKGIALQGLNMSEFREIDVIIPPMSLQLQFATFVEQTDKSKFAIQQSLDKLETLKKALMQEYFG